MTGQTANLGVFKVTNLGLIETATQFDMIMAQEADTYKAAMLYGRASEAVAPYIFKVSNDCFYVTGGYNVASAACSELCSAPSRKYSAANNDNKARFGLAETFNKSHNWASNIFNPAAAPFGGMASYMAKKIDAAPMLTAA